MIKFFRKIRQTLLSEGKTGKYLKYAIGEIMLVVIGILIALSINNWNEAKKEHQLETNILNEILSNLESDLKNLDEKIENNKRFINHQTAVLEHLNNNLPITDSLRYDYAWLTGDSRFTPNAVGYENLKSMGLNIIRNENLKKEISALYAYKYPLFIEEIKKVCDSYRERLIGEMSENINYIIPLEKAEPINLKELRLNIQFKNAVVNFRKSIEWSNGRFKGGKEEIELVMQSIRNELNK
ncbi:MAG: DUF6090 family protein [Bacteroidota bacterium]